MRLVSPGQRTYITAHPLALWFSLGIAVAVTLSLLFPGLVDQSAASLALPGWLHDAFSGTYVTGAWFSVFGIVRGKAKFEAAGMALLASALSVQFASAAYVIHSTAIAGSFLVFLAIGCALRSRHLARTGY